VEQLRGRSRSCQGPLLRPQLLDDWLGVPGHAQVYLETRLVGGEAQVPIFLEKEEVQHVREQDRPRLSGRQGEQGRIGQVLYLRGVRVKIPDG